MVYPTFTIAALLAATLAIGCESAQTAAKPATQPSSQLKTPRVTLNRPSTKTPLLVDGQPVLWSEIQPLLAEAVGGAIVEEIALTRVLNREAERLGVTITPNDTRAEESDLIGSVQSASALSEDDAVVMLEQIRNSRGLGEHRYAALLRRNAILRKLVADRVEVLDEEVALAIQINTGERRRVRVIVSPTEREASAARGQLEGLPVDQLPFRFAELATERSIDATAPAGGLLGEISIADPAFPEIVRRSLASVPAGRMTPVLALGNGYAIVLVETVIPAAPEPSAAEKERFRTELRRRKERIEMDRLATELLDRASIGILDPSLGWSHRALRGG